MARLSNEVHDGEQRWVPWMGLALVAPAVIVLLVGVFGIVSGARGNGSGPLFGHEGPGVLGVAAGGITFVCTLAALMLGLVGLVRGVRRNEVHNGHSVGVAGLTLEIALVVVATGALVLLGFAIL